MPTHHGRELPLPSRPWPSGQTLWAPQDQFACGHALLLCQSRPFPAEGYALHLLGAPSCSDALRPAPHGDTLP